MSKLSHVVWTVVALTVTSSAMAVTAPTVEVAEPSSVVMLATGLVMALVLRKKR